jgi:hypothetical protein
MHTHTYTFTNSHAFTSIGAHTPHAHICILIHSNSLNLRRIVWNIYWNIIVIKRNILAYNFSGQNFSVSFLPKYPTDRVMYPGFVITKLQQCRTHEKCTGILDNHTDCQAYKGTHISLKVYFTWFENEHIFLV